MHATVAGWRDRAADSQEYGAGFTLEVFLCSG
jgi:hypothetical protein